MLHPGRPALAALLLAFAFPTFPQTLLPPPKMSEAEGVRLFAAAGFRIGSGTALNLCGQPARPKLAFVDLNGDGRPEAIAIDRNAACYGAPGDWFTVVMKDASGRWRAIMRDTGVLTWEKTRTRGWVDARRSGGGRCDRIARFDGSGYIPSSACVASVAQAPAQAQAPARAQAGAPSAGSAPAANNMTVAERAAIFRAAGLKQKGADWVGCDGNTKASIEKDDVRDINGDGNLDAVITERGTYCYGHTGQGFHLLTKTPGGGWKVLFQSPGIPDFLKTGANGWPDVRIGGPGFCFPVMRWDGKTYVFNRNYEEQKGACARQRQ